MTQPKLIVSWNLPRLRGFTAEEFDTGPRLIVSWNLKGLAVDLAAHLESLIRSGELSEWDMVLESEEYLQPYGLSPNDENTVTILAWGTQCVDCSDTRDYFMVYDDVWKDAWLEPHQCCCTKCLEVRLGRPLKIGDFTAIVSAAWSRRQHPQSATPRALSSNR